MENKGKEPIPVDKKDENKEEISYIRERMRDAIRESIIHSNNCLKFSENLVFFCNTEDKLSDGRELIEVLEEVFIKESKALEDVVNVDVSGSRLKVFPKLPRDSFSYLNISETHYLKTFRFEGKIELSVISENTALENPPQSEFYKAEQQETPSPCNSCCILQ